MKLRLIALTGLLLLSIACRSVETHDTSAVSTPQDQSAANVSAKEKVSFPGLTMDFDKRHLDIPAKVCLDEGLLEVVACTPDSKEHESLVVIEAAPSHVHAALLLLGANNGSPAMAKPANAEQTRWIHYPPRGDAVLVSMVYTDARGKPIERPIADFIKRNEALDDGFCSEPTARVADPFPATFLFAGSVIQPDDTGHRHYLADYSGHVVTISTFGDGVLCLPLLQSQDNASLAWQTDPTHLPKIGTPVTLRLTLTDDAVTQE